MKRIETTAELHYDVQSPTDFLFQVAVATNEHQTILEESLTVEPELPIELCGSGVDGGDAGLGNRLHRLHAQPGALTLRYRAIVELVQDVARPNELGESDYALLPAGVLPYLNPSRYCESDRLLRYAWEEFGSLTPGHTRIERIVDFVNAHLSYTPGSTGPSTTACDVLVQRTGVCRDYAHLAIALCRAIGVPARYVAGYAVDLQPPDFHGFFEAWLVDTAGGGAGAWYLFDATRLAPIAGFVRIGAGRDAADCSFATLIGSAMSDSPQVMARDLDAGSSDDAPLAGAVSTA